MLNSHNIPIEIYKKNRISIVDGEVYIHRSLYHELLDTSAAIRLYRKQSWYRRIAMRLFYRNIVLSLQDIQQQKSWNALRSYINSTVNKIHDSLPLYIWIYSDDSDKLKLIYHITATSSEFLLRKIV